MLKPASGVDVVQDLLPFALIFIIPADIVPVGFVGFAVVDSTVFHVETEGFFGCVDVHAHGAWRNVIDISAAGDVGCRCVVFRCSPLEVGLQGDISEVPVGSWVEDPAAQVSSVQKIFLHFIYVRIQLGPVKFGYA